MNKIRVICIGLDRDWVSQWRARPEVQLVGLVDIYHEEADFGPEGDIPIFQDYRAALKQLKADLVIYVTPPDAKTRPDVIETVLNQGYDVFLAKWRPESGRDCERLLEVSRKTGRQIGIGEMYRYDSLVERAKQVIEEGALGRIEHIVWSCYRPNVTAAWMNAYRHVMLEDLSYHHFGVIHYLIAPHRFQNVFACSTLASWSRERSPNVVSLIAQSEEGIQLTYHASWAVEGKPTSWLGEFRIEGSKGNLELRDNRLTLTEREGEPKLLEPVTPYPYGLQLGVIHEYIQAWLEKRRTVLDIEGFQPVAQMIYGAVESAETGLRISL